MKKIKNKMTISGGTGIKFWRRLHFVTQANPWGASPPHISYQQKYKNINFS